MSPFWTSFFEDVKDCGRDATLFVVTLGAMILGLVVVLIICLNELHKYIIPALAVVGGLAMVWACVSFRRVHARRRGRLQNSRLSDDELRVARLKLIKHRKVSSP
jgi:hypothetical protein